MKMRRISTLLAAAALVAACGGGKPAPQAEAPAKPADPGKLNIYIWSAYLPQEVIDKFAAQTGIKVNFDLYDSNEALLEKLQSGVADYDIVVPSDYMVKILIAEKLIQPIDHGKLANIGNLDPRFLDKKFDPRNQYSLPYFWGTTGFGYDKKKVKGPVDSWSVLFDPKIQGAHPDARRRARGLRRGAQVDGPLAQHDRPGDPQAGGGEAQEAEETGQDLQQRRLRQHPRRRRRRHRARLQRPARRGRRQGARAPRLRRAEGGGTFWMDNVAIPAKARNVENAYKFLDYIMQAEVNAEIVNGVSYASANVPAKQFIKPEILNDAAIYPSDEVLSRCEFIEDVGDATTLLDQYWTEIKAE